MPVAFVAHGSPLNAVDNVWGPRLSKWASDMPRPQAILAVSAHWEQSPAALGPSQPVSLIYDFYGFPRELYELRYDAPAAPELARRVRGLLEESREPVVVDPRRGLDHGTWVPAIRMYPNADVPVLQLSLPTMNAERLFRLGRALAPLRDEGVLILGSGNLTHNLRTVDWSPNPKTPAWAQEFDSWIEETLSAGDTEALIDYRQRAPGVEIALPTHEHFVPLILAAGAAYASGYAEVGFPVTGFDYGSLTMRCIQFGA